MARLVGLSGLGADATLFLPQQRAFPELRVLPWLAPAPGETLRAYAARMGGQIPPDDPVVLVGVSFGGMLAFELAAHPAVRRVVQVASSRGPDALAASAHLGARAALRVPGRLLRPPRLVWPLVAAGFGAHGPAARAVVYRSLATADPAFVQWGLRAILSWQPGAGRADAIVHGAGDRLIRVSRVGATHVVPGAGHLVNVTHAPEVNAVLASVLAGA